jgi:hypothetical protein
VDVGSRQRPDLHCRLFWLLLKQEQKKKKKKKNGQPRNPPKPLGKRGPTCSFFSFPLSLFISETLTSWPKRPERREGSNPICSPVLPGHLLGHKPKAAHHRHHAFTSFDLQSRQTSWWSCCMGMPPFPLFSKA